MPIKSVVQQHQRRVDANHDEYYGSDEDEDDLSPIEYAIRHKLISDHRDEPPLRAVGPPPSLDEQQRDLEDPDVCQSLGTIVCMNSLNGDNAHEKWDVDRETIDFLASVFALAKGDPVGLCDIDDTLRLDDLRMEEMLLTVDPELDVLLLKERNKVKVSTAGMKPFVLIDEQGESFDFSDGEKRNKEILDRGLSNEKFDMDTETMEYLREVVNFGATAKEQTFDDLYDSDTILFPEPVSPPLLPLSPSLSPMRFLTSAEEVEFTSTPEDLCAAEAKQLERSILERSDEQLFDAPTSEDSHKGSDAIASLSALATPVVSSSSPSHRKGLEDLRASTPLILMSMEETPVKRTKSVSFPSDIQNIIPDAEMSLSDAKEDIDEFINDVVMPLAESVINEVENEELSEIDTTMRVPVPDVDEIELLPPWKMTAHRPQKALLSSVKQNMTKEDLKWSGVSKIERLLPWSPFPAYLGKIQIDETFDDGSSAEYMAEMNFEEQPDLEALIDDAGGLRILHAHEKGNEELHPVDIDDDELSDKEQLPTTARCSNLVKPSNGQVARTVPEDTKATTDMQLLLRKRKLELEGASTTKPQEKRPNVHKTDFQYGNKAAAQSTTFDKLYRSGVGLSGFMRLHGRNIEKDSHFTTDQQITPQDNAAGPVPVLDSAIQDGNEHSTPVIPPEAPAIKALDGPTSIIVSSELSVNRQLIRQIQAKLPNVDIIEREPLQPLETVGQSAAKKSCQPEADITISPSTGLIITTLQKLKQKPLPGQSSFFGIRERISAIATRYERLIVLVSEARHRADSKSPITCPLEESDAEALSDVTSFAASLDTDVEVYFVAGGEPQLVQWIAAFISRHVRAHPEMKLIHDETLWERFLRTAGLNAFAAQAVLAKLKVPVGSEGDGSSDVVESVDGAPYGLTAFMQMSAQQRMELCGQSMGVCNVLQRVNQLVDGRWTSASAVRH